MQALLNLIRFPFLFLFYLGSGIAAALGLKDNRGVPIAFVAAVTLAIGLTLKTWLGGGSESAEESGAVAGLYFIPADIGDSVIRVTTLEAALGQFHFRHGRSPKDYRELQQSGVISGLPEAKAGHELQIDFETPAIIEVPSGTPPPRHPDDPPEKEAADEL